MTTSSGPRDYRTLVAAASLIAGPLLMAIGDLLHPAERMAPAEQAAILLDHASRWYAAHLLLFDGMLLFIPGLLALAALAEARRPAFGYVARILVLIGVAAIVPIFVAEMLVGRYVLDGADPAAATALLESMFSGPMAAVVGPAMFAFFVGTVAFAIPLVRTGGRLGWAAALILTGVLLVLAEILSARVIFSQIGNIVAFSGTSMMAWLILRGAVGMEAASR
jgi:hypothetical protein